MKILELHQGTDEWLKSRKESFNASETPALFELSPWIPRNPLELAHLKYGDLAVPQTFRMSEGIRNEEWIREYVEEKTQIAFEPLVGVWEQDERFRASFDGVSFGLDVILEIKYSEKTFNTDEIPQNYYYQIQHQLLVSGADKCLFAVADPNTKEVRIEEVYPNKDIQSAIVAKWEWFVEKFKDKELPPLEQVREDDEWKQAVEEYKIAERLLKEAQEALQLKKQRLIELSGGVKTRGAGALVYPVVRKSVSYSQVVKDLGVKVDEKYVKENVSWRINYE